MDNLLAQLKTSELEIKLTEDKLFLKTITSQETFALRGVQGIGVIDLVDAYNAELLKFNAKRNTRRAAIGLIIACVLGALYSWNVEPDLAILIIPLCVGGIFSYIKAGNSPEPTLMSQVRIMMSGGVRNFSFDKAHVNSVDVANFIAKVESTLSAYHKN